MDSSIHATLAHFASAHPATATGLTILLCFGATFLILQEIFTPVGKRQAPAGKQWRLPPRGPSEIPIFGNLLALKAARDDLNHGKVDVYKLLSKAVYQYCPAGVLL